MAQKLPELISHILKTFIQILRIDGEVKLSVDGYLRSVDAEVAVPAAMLFAVAIMGTPLCDKV